MTENIIYTSHVSFFEIAIKQKIGKLSNLQISTSDLEKRILDDGFELLHLRTKHIDKYNAIPLFADHKDPFDKMLLATAASEMIPSDRNFQLYSDLVEVISI